MDLQQRTSSQDRLAPDGDDDEDEERDRDTKDVASSSASKRTIATPVRKSTKGDPQGRAAIEAKINAKKAEIAARKGVPPKTEANGEGASRRDLQKGNRESEAARIKDRMVALKKALALPDMLDIRGVAGRFSIYVIWIA